MKKIFLTILMAGLLFTGCKEEFLEYYPTTSIDENAAFSTIENANAVLFGVYDMLTGPSTLGGNLICTNEVRADDSFIAQALNWSFYTVPFNYTQVASTTTSRGGPRVFWRNLYSVIENANAAISADLPFVGAAADEYLSEMKMVRALAYFSLVQLYCMPYTYDNGASPGIPVYEVSDASVFGGRGTVQQVYDLIEADLAFARVNAAPLGGAAGGATRFTKAFALGLSARVALTKGEYANAYTHAIAAIADAPAINTNMTDYKLGFSHENNENIYRIPFNSDDYGIYIGLSSFYDHPEGYGGNFFTKVLFDMYAADDVRKEWFPTPLFYNIANGAKNAFFGDLIYDTYHFDGWYGPGATEINNVFIAGVPVTGADFYPVNTASDVHNRPGHYSLYGKFPRADAQPGIDRGSVGLGQPPLMRTSELVLIKAECEARGEGSGVTAARATLLTIQQRAQPSAVISTNAGQALIDEVLIERRKELAGEGFRMNDILRLGLPLVRPNIPGPNWSAVMTLPAYSPRMIYPIPEEEIDANDNISAEEQNPGY